MDELIEYAKSFLGTPYVYGGNHKLSGIDCSGLVCELLKSVGVLKNGEDLSAQMLYDRFSQDGTWNKAQRGCIAFYGESGQKVSHVGFCISPYLMIEAGGGDSSTKTIEDAKLKGALVRMRPILYRKDFLYVIKPHYTGIGIL